jgi:excisionase family DNA binding protein
MTDDWLDLDQAAALLGTERQEVYMLVRHGTLLAVRLSGGRWRIHRLVIEAYRP